MSYNQNCYFALSTDTSEKAYAVGTGGYSFWNSDFTLGIDFYVLQNSKEMILFKQDQVIVIGYDSTCFYVNVCGTRFTVSYSAMQPIPKVWNTVVVTYDKESALLTGYINGAKGFEKNVSEIDLNVSSNSCYEVVPMFYGYIRHSYCIAKCHTQAEVCNISNLITSELNECEFAFDFTDKIPSDKGKHRLPILLSGFASVKNIVSTVDFGQLGYACPDKSSHINIGNTKSNSFTIIVNLYLNDSRDKHIVFAKEGAALDGISLSVDYSSGNPLFTYKHGTDIHEFDGNFSLYEWTNVAITFSGGFLSVYKDGSKIYEGTCSELTTDISNYAFTIGNTASGLGYKSFCGYIDYLCVFDDVKTEDQIVQYVSVVPSIYSKNAIAMFNLSNMQLYETIHGIKYSLIGNAEHVIAEDTQNVACDPVYELGDEENARISDYEYWQATILAEVIVEYITMNGIQVNMGYDANKKLNRSTAQKLMDTIGTQYHSTELCANYQNITAELISAFIGMLLNIGAYSVVVPMFASSKTAVDTSAGVSVVAIGGIGTFSMFFYTILKISEDRYSNLWKDLWNVPPNNQDEPTDDDEKKDAYVKISLKSIQFAHTPSDQQSSAVFLRHDYSLSDEGTPEWESDIQEKSISDALYIVNSDAKIKVRATLSVLLKNQTYTGKIYVVAGSQKNGDGILGNMIPVELNANSSGDYTLYFELEKNNFNGAKIGKYFDYLTWKGDMVGLFASTSHNTWILEKQPLEQWVIDKESTASNISVKTLNILNDIRMYDATKEAGEKLDLSIVDGWLKKMVHYIQDSGKFSYNLEKRNNYSSEYDSEITFNFRLFEQHYSQSTIEFSSKDSAMLLVVISALLGYCVKITYLFSNDENETQYSYNSSEKTLKISPDYVVFTNVLQANGNEIIKYFNVCTYYVVFVDKDDLVYIYDPNIRKCIDTSTASYQYLYAIPFTEKELANDSYCTLYKTSSYREILVPCGNSCYYSKRAYVTSLSCDAINEQPSISAIFYNDEVNAFMRDRHVNQPTHTFMQSIGVIDYENPCSLSHRIAYSFIEKAIVYASNMLVDEYNQEHREVAITALKRLVEAIFPDNRDFYDTEYKYIHDSAQKLECMQIVEWMRTYLIPANANLLQANTAINSLLYTLAHNSYFNLKCGNSTWNRYISDKFDLDTSWEFNYICQQRNNRLQYQIKCRNGRCETVDINNWKDEAKPGLFLSSSDTYRYEKLILICDSLLMTLPNPIVYESTNLQDLRYIAASSELQHPPSDWSPTKRRMITRYTVYSNAEAELFDVE